MESGKRPPPAQDNDNASEAGEEDSTDLPDVCLAIASSSSPSSACSSSSSGNDDDDTMSLLLIAVQKQLSIVRRRQNSSSTTVSTIGLEYVVRAATFTKCGRFCVVAGDGKIVQVFDAQTLQLVSTSEKHGKRITSVAVTSAPSVVFSDKGGECYECPLPDLNAGGTKRLVLGHISTITCTRFTENQKYLLTCDRDEKVRVTCWPDTYRIQSFCLGHTQFVTAVVPFQTSGNEWLAVSGGGDGTLRLWRLEDGRCLDATPISTTASSSTGSSLATTSTTVISLHRVTLTSSNGCGAARQFVAALVESDLTATTSAGAGSSSELGIHFFEIDCSHHRIRFVRSLSPISTTISSVSSSSSSSVLLQICVDNSSLSNGTAHLWSLISTPPYLQCWALALSDKNDGEGGPLSVTAIAVPDVEQRLAQAQFSIPVVDANGCGAGTGVIDGAGMSGSTVKELQRKRQRMAAQQQQKPPSSASAV